MLLHKDAVGCLLDDVLEMYRYTGNINASNINKGLFFCGSWMGLDARSSEVLKHIAPLAQMQSSGGIALQQLGWTLLKSPLQLPLLLLLAFRS